MSVTLDLDASIEANLSRAAAASGMPLAAYIAQLLGHNPTGPIKTPADRAALWRDGFAALTPASRILSDEAMSRESIYATTR